MRTAARLAVTASLCLLAGCGGAPADTGTPAATPATAVAPGIRNGQPADAAAIIKQLQKANIGLANVAIQDEDGDPNNLYGRPNGYTSRASADLPGGNKAAEKYTVDHGLVVEGFANADDAHARARYIKTLQEGSPILGTEWHYMVGEGTVLIRVTGNVKPSLAKKIGQAVESL